MRIFALLVLAALYGCATSQSVAGSADPNRVTAEEIAASGGSTAYDIVDRLRPTWFRDQLTGREVSVYLDNEQTPYSREALRDIPAQDVAELQYLDGQTAIMRWGQAASGGAIVVIRRR
ncbi:MAG: hypothetical protein NUW01_06220 [Gemmatimonadaceae bacterium]|nr:hypothetical protein [Gemmatimonadaceae bacterium]